ncbi:hypothetical protein ACO0K2_04430 [Undibacterium sp. MH2W]|uniref:hypothetical protein n=1 Tax=Undibacterium sp. MH2W TaxID=3413044 RepID=UPI003BF1F2AA
MAYIRKDRVKETTYTTGTGALTLNGAMLGSQRFSAVCNIGDTFSYGLQGVDANGVLTGDWETGIGTYSALNVITRTKVHDSSNNGRLVNLSAPVTQVWIGITAEDFNSLISVASGAVPASVSANAALQVITQMLQSTMNGASCTDPSTRPIPTYVGQHCLDLSLGYVVYARQLNPPIWQNSEGVYPL